MQDDCHAYYHQLLNYTIFNNTVLSLLLHTFQNVSELLSHFIKRKSLQLISKFSSITFSCCYIFYFIQKKNCCSFLVEAIKKITNYNIKFLINCPQKFSSGFQNSCYPNSEAGLGTSITSASKVLPQETNRSKERKSYKENKVSLKPGGELIRPNQLLMQRQQMWMKNTPDKMLCCQMVSGKS